MPYRILLTRIAEKQLKNLQKKDRQHVLGAFEILKYNPNAGKLLEGELKGYRSLRVWPYRIIYKADHGTITITIVKIGHRKDVYR